MNPRLRTLLRNTKGNVVALTAFSMPMLVGALAFGLDMIQIAVFNRELQRAADSAALSGAYAALNRQEIHKAAQDALTKNPHPTLARPINIVTEPWSEFRQTVRVDLQAQASLPFLEFFGQGRNRLKASARAALASADERYCVLSMYDGSSTGIELSGTSDIELDCAVMANSSSREAIKFKGGATLAATVASAVGDFDAGSDGFVPPTELSPHSIRQFDPLAYLPDPPDFGDDDDDSRCLEAKVKAGEVKVLAPGCYSKLDLSGTVTLLPGTYYVNGGDVDFGSKSRVFGQGVTIVLTGEDGDAGTIKWGGGATVNLSSSASGEYPGVLFYRDRRADNEEITITGNADLNLVGAIYAPGSDIKMTGGGKINVTCLQLIGRRMKVSGNFGVASDCPEESGAQPFRFLRVRLVQ